jgi:hypothetical protein
MTSKLPTLIVVGLLALSVVGAGGVFAQQEIRVDGEPDFEVYTPDDRVYPGEVTELTIQLDNEGELKDGQESNRQLVTTARNVVVELDPEDSPIEVTTGRQAIGTVSEDAPGEAAFQIEVPDDIDPGTYELEVDVDYRYTESVREIEGLTDQNQRSSSDTHTVEIEVDDGPQFNVENVSSTLRVGETGEITGEVVNTGEQDATNVEVQFPTENENLFPLETAVAVGDIPSGESAEFRIPIEVGSEAEAVPKRFDIPVSFRNEMGIRNTDNSPELLAEIGPERDAFSIESTDRSISAGSSSTVEFTITNNREETLSDIEPKLFTDTPFSSSSDEAFVESLEPGESETISFDLSAAGSATPKTYPVTLDIRYEDASGDSHITDSYRLPIGVVQAEEGGLLGSFGTIIISVISLLAVGGGYVWYRDQ